MIRRDYVMKLVAEMAQVLARVLMLKDRHEHDEALREIDRALKDLRGRDPGDDEAMNLDGWIALCRKHEQAAAGLMVAVGDLLVEQGDSLTVRNRPGEAVRSQHIALGLFLEALLNGQALVSAGLLDKVDRLLPAVRRGTAEAAVWRRVVNYFVARGCFGRAEDTIFEWLESGDASAPMEGTAFFEQLLGMDDVTLERGEFPRSEVEAGRREFIEAAASRRSGTGT